MSAALRRIFYPCHVNHGGGGRGAELFTALRESVRQKASVKKVNVPGRSPKLL